MKKLSFSVIITLLAVVSIVGGALAEGTDLPGTGWFSGETIQNVSGATATVQILAYPQTGTTTYTAASRQVNAGSITTFSPGDFTGMPAGFEGSAIVSADQDIRAVVNVTNRYNASSGLGDPDTLSPAAGQYQGVNAGATTINFALVKNDSYGKSTTFYIQNAGGSAATATATFMLPNANASGATVVAYTYTTPSIGPGQMAVITPSDARNGGNPPPSGNFIIGSLTVTSAQPLAGTVLEHKTVEAHATVLQATRAFTPADYSQTVYAPTNKNAFFNRFTGLQIQNVTSGPIDIDVVYTGLPNSTCTGQTFPANRDALPAGASHTFPSSVLPAGCLAAATVTATGNIVGVVNESYTSAFLAANPGKQQESTTYSALSAANQTTKISVPVYKEYSYGKGTGVSIQNVGGSTAHVTIQFSGPAGTFTSKVIDIAPGAAFNISDARNKNDVQLWGSNTPMTPAALGCGTGINGCALNGTMGLIVTSDQPIVAIANESTYPFTAPLISQDKNNYEGFNLVP